MTNDHSPLARTASLRAPRALAAGGTPDTRRLVLIGSAVAGAYVVAAHIGFRFAFVAEQITTVWAPTGIALAAFLFWGLRVWPAIWLGAFLANAGTAAPIWTSFVIASGNTFEGALAVVALRRLPQFVAGLDARSSSSWTVNCPIYRRGRGARQPPCVILRSHSPANRSHRS